MLIVYSYYVLDFLHAGHVLFMRNAKAIAGDNGKHIVGILTDEAVMEKKGRPVMRFDERMEIAKAIRYADIVVPQESYSPISNIQRIVPDVMIESTSHDQTSINEVKSLMDNLGGKIIVLPYYPHQSSTALKVIIRNSSATLKT
jgi:cytidyltransferase-like protein